VNLSLSRTSGALLASLALAAGALVATAPGAGALVQITVSSNADSGGGSLRDAFTLANATDDDVEIIIPASVGDITLTTGALVYSGGVGNDETLTLTGGGNTITQTVDDARVIFDTANTLFTMSGLTITGGDAGPVDSGGGIFVQGSATITNSTITGNEAGDSAAGIRVSNGPLIVTDSTISNNTAGTGVVGGRAAGGAFSSGPMTITRSTISGNTAALAGGVASNEVMTVVNSTVTGNTATEFEAGGLYSENGLVLVYATVVDNFALPQDFPPFIGGANIHINGGGLESFASVVALPRGGAPNCGEDEPLPTTSYGYNWDDDGTCGFDQPTDHSDSGDPELGPLADNGGPTRTRAPADTSGLVGDIPATACGDGDDLAGSAVTTDQRGEPRPDVTTGACDIGAVELQDPAPPAPPAPIVLEPTFTG
jgi:hypothetical protein